MSRITAGARVRCGTLVLGLLAASLMCAGGAAAQCQPPPGNAFAFLSLGNQRCPPTPLVHWATPAVTYSCGFLADGKHDISCGESSSAACVERCREAATTWTDDLVGRFHFVEADTAHPVTFCDSTDGRTSIGGSSTFCGGQAFMSNVIAVTLRVTITNGPQRGQQKNADIVINSKFDSFTPNFFRAVIEHELGHVLGLAHPDECGPDANVLMRSALRFADGDPCFVGAPTPDDVNGAMTIYSHVEPGPTPSPAPLCGDADGDGMLTESDSASVLAAAVDLPSHCDAAPARCDVDATGGVDVIDAANVLRRAFGLSGAMACPP